VGRCAPEIRLSSVDLPAPFGPITPSSSPEVTSRLTSETATTPPKRLPTPRRERSGTCSVATASALMFLYKESSTTTKNVPRSNRACAGRRTTCTRRRRPGSRGRAGDRAQSGGGPGQLLQRLEVEARDELAALGDERERVEQLEERLPAAVGVA